MDWRYLLKLEKATRVAVSLTDYVIGHHSYRAFIDKLTDGTLCVNSQRQRLFCMILREVEVGVQSEDGYSAPPGIFLYASTSRQHPSS